MRNSSIKLNYDVASHIGALFVRLHNRLLEIVKIGVYPATLIDGAQSLKERAFTAFIDVPVVGDTECLYFDLAVYDEIMDDLYTIRNGFAPYWKDDLAADILSIIDSIRASFNENERRFM